MLDPCHDGDGLASTPQSINDCWLPQRLFRSFDKLCLFIAKNAKAFEVLVMENPNTLTCHKVQDTFKHSLVHCQRGITDFTFYPKGELVSLKLVLENVEACWLRIRSGLARGSFGGRSGIFSGSFWVTLGSSWDHLGIVLGSC